MDPSTSNRYSRTLRRRLRSMVGPPLNVSPHVAPSRSGININPAPCALAMIQDQLVRSQKPTRIPTQIGCRVRHNLQPPNPRRIVAPPSCSHPSGTAVPSTKRTNTTSPIASAWPKAIGIRAPNTAPRDRFCNPSATANNHPMAGLSPCQAPNRTDFGGTEYGLRNSQAWTLGTSGTPGVVTPSPNCRQL
jgi:hypothetical protein